MNSSRFWNEFNELENDVLIQQQRDLINFEIHFIDRLRHLDQQAVELPKRDQERFKTESSKLFQLIKSANQARKQFRFTSRKPQNPSPDQTHLTEVTSQSSPFISPIASIIPDSNNRIENLSDQQIHLDKSLFGGHLKFLNCQNCKFAFDPKDEYASVVIESCTNCSFSELLCDQLRCHDSMQILFSYLAVKSGGIIESCREICVALDDDGEEDDLMCKIKDFDCPACKYSPNINFIKSKR